MKKMKLNIDEWEQKVPQNATSQEPAKTAVNAVEAQSDIDVIVERIEEAGVDITGTYQAWLSVGFALADELGESGRSYFHRISRFYAGYSPEEADKQYDHCLSSKGSGITIKSLYQLAKENGISLITRSSAVSAEPVTSAAPGAVENVQMPTFSPQTYTRLPRFLADIVAVATTDQERDTLLIGSIATLSAVLPNVYGVYDQKTVFPNLYFFLTARASSGKGRLSLCSSLISSIDRELMDQNAAAQEAYELAERAYQHDKKNLDARKPQEPPFLKILIPGNVSATALYKILYDNGGRGLLFETEGDTITVAVSSDFGNYSDSLRKAFHGEQISYHRRKDNEHVEVQHPQLSVVLSGTPMQVLGLIPDPENGLFSRFLFYYLESQLDWKDVFAHSDARPLDDQFRDFGNRMHDFYNALVKLTDPLRFSFTFEQQARFNSFFAAEQARIFAVWGDPMLATVRRLGLCTFRVAMILSTLRRMETGDLYTPEVCCDDDFDTVLDLAAVLLRHAEKVYSSIYGKQPLGQAPATGNLKQIFFDNLPDEFETADYVAIAKSIGLNPRTAEGYINKAANNRNGLERIAQGRYHRIR